MNKKSIFVINRLNSIGKTCEYFPIKFDFISGQQNMADAITRPLSFKVLEKSSYWLGPVNLDFCDQFSFILPNQNIVNNGTDDSQSPCIFTSTVQASHIVNTEYFNSFNRTSKVLYYVLKFCSVLIEKIRLKKIILPRHFIEASTI